VLNDEGVPSPRNAEWAHIYSGVWTASTIRSILTNPMYVGDLVWNRRTDARFFKVSNGRATERREAYGARLVPNPEEDWIHVEEGPSGLRSSLGSGSGGPISGFDPARRPLLGQSPGFPRSSR
jgi:hypothetical protein